MATIDQSSGVTDIANGHGSLVPLGNRFDPVPALPWPVSGSIRPDILSAKPTPVGLLHALRRRWSLALLLGLLAGGLLAGLIWMLVPVRYESWSLLRVAQFAPGSATGSSLVGLGSDFINFKRDQQNLVTTPLVINSALRTLQSKKNGMLAAVPDVEQGEWLRKQLSIDFPGDGQIMRISMKGSNPREVRDIVDAVTKAYLAEIVSKEANELQKRISDLALKFETTRTEILKDRDQLNKSITLLTGGVQTQMVQRQMAEQNLRQLAANMNQREERVRDTELKLKLAQTRNETWSKFKIPESVIEEELSRDPQVAGLLQEIQKQQTEFSALNARVPNKQDRRLQGMSAQLAQLQEQLEETMADKRPQILERIAMGGARGLEAFAAVPLLETELAELKKAATDARELYDEEIKKISRFDRTSAEIDQKESDIKDKQAFNAKVGAELNLLRTEAGGGRLERVTEIERAVEPTTNDAIRKYLATAFAGLTGLGLVVFGVAFGEFQTRRLNSTRDVNEGLGLHVIGHLPPLSGRAWRKLQSGSGGALRTQLLESIDSIRTALLHNTIVESPRVVMVTSGDAHEGKTTVACQLAISLARSGRRTVLVDADLRNPTVHRVFDLPQDPGLAEMLRRHVEHAGHVHATQQPNLWLMPAGQADLFAVQALSSSQVAQLVEGLKQEFDFVIIDTGAVLSVADAMLIGQHADAAILATQRDCSKLPQIYEAVERLRSVGIVVLGTVVNGVSSSSKRFARRQLPESVAS